jgi:hypothetical protein
VLPLITRCTYTSFVRVSIESMACVACRVSWPASRLWYMLQYARLQVRYHQSTWRHERVWRCLRMPRSGHAQHASARAARMALRCSPRPRVRAICAPEAVCKCTWLDKQVAGRKCVGGRRCVIGGPGGAAYRITEKELKPVTSSSWSLFSLPLPHLGTPP